MAMVKTGIGVDSVPKNGATEWKFLEHDVLERADYYERVVCTDDGKYVVQIACKGDGIKRTRGETNNSPLTLHHEFEKWMPSIQVRPMTDEERELAIRRRGRGMGIEPSTVIVTLADQHGFFASVSTDVDGGMGVAEEF